WGLIFTPMQAVKNVSGLVGGPPPQRPSDELKRAVLKMMAAQLAAQATMPPPLTRRGFDVILPEQPPTA
ncbi:MAG: hypothetical protein JWM57_25, partial [Phycisphaerales bacterium]|nr:hypothetical protein [Phycisphaerales bacterium]